ncbi:hypothetical protein C8J56DRAFT_1004370 [Mycena floridula]|nr:hypothetical protein C8J56DRAFT_1004370 [Mycena floridula]
MVRQGLFPCSAVKIKVAISTATLELFRSLFVRCPPNACPCCLYELDNEPQLQYSMFFTMDGNDSLKRMHRHERIVDELGDRLGKTKERIDVREGGGDYFLPRKEVDGWDIHLDPEKPVEEGPQGCDQWHNSKESNTRPMWQIYDETGIFLSLCRHGFVLLIADMVQSGELMKYAIATLNRFFGILPPGMGGGYDIGCTFEVTLRNSPLGPRASEELYTSLVGLFHGYSHNRLCQLLKLVLYLQGMGLEDFETCERFFSLSNALASATRHASILHRRQAIVEYSRHSDSFHAYANLSTFLVNNYKQALAILETEAAFNQSMTEAGISSPEVFQDWLQEELVYLKTRVMSEVPEREKLEIEYYLLLVKLKETRDALDAIQHVWLKNDNPETLANPERDKTATVETKRRQARERHTAQHEEVLAMELRLQISPEARWKVGDANWVLNAERASMEKYQKCLDRLEGLVVERIMELAKTNQAQTGQAVKKRSKAIRTALDNYNAAALKLIPPRPTLDWDTVIECAFLSEFELLRDARQDIRNRPWAKPAGRALQHQHFKILRAREEIVRCNVEISRLWTHMLDEKAYLECCESEVRATDPALAYQICQYRQERGRCDATHVKRLTALAKIPGFTGSLTAGKHDGLTDADSSGDDDDGMTDADASGDEDNEVLVFDWFADLVQVSMD